VHSLAVSFALVPVGVAVLLYCPWWLRQCNAVDGRLAARLLGPPLGHRVRELEQTRARAVVSNIFSKLGLAPSDADHRRVLAVLHYLES
jgi:hypothetical protein